MNTAILENKVNFENLEDFKKDFMGNLKIFKERISPALKDMLFNKDFLNFVKPIIEENSPSQAEFLISIIKDELEFHEDSQFNDTYLELWNTFDDENIQTAPLYIKLAHDWLELN